MFFTETELAKHTEPNCFKCGLKETCDRYQVKHFRGVGTDVVALFSTPSGETEYTGKLAGLPLYVAQGLLSGQRFGVNYAIACHSPKPTESQVEYCSPLLYSTMEEYKPRVVYCFGPEALLGMIRFVWKQSIGPYSRWIGEKIPVHFENFSCWVVPLYDAREYDKKQTGNTAFAISKRFLVNEERPEKKKPNVWLLYETAPILQAIKEFTASETPVAFDYETTGLKPDESGHKILCVGMSNGAKTVSFQLSEGKIREAFVGFLKSRVPKVAANLKFEERWSRRILKTRVNNWVWDTMLSAHFTNPSRKAAGLKFQAFVKMGIPPYDEEVEEFIGSKNPNGKNALESIDKHKLLQYCGTDAWAEYELFKTQSEG